MKKNFNLEKIKEEGRRIFLAEQNEKLYSIINYTLNLRLTQKMEDLREIKRFFHSLKGSSGIFDFMELSKIASILDEFVGDVNTPAGLNHKFFSILLEGLANVKRELNFVGNCIKTNCNNYEELKSTEFNENKYKIPVEYIFKIGNGQILVIDDDPSILKIIKDIFTKEGFNVITLQNPHNAMEILSSQEFDLIILDVVMLDISGFELCHKIRTEKINTPIIFLTSENNVNNKIKGLKIGANDYLLKPFDINELIVRVMKIIENEIIHKQKLYLDETTGAYTENLFKENFKIASYRHSKVGEVFSVALIDIDDFKNINICYGYDKGNSILRKFFDELRNFLRNSDQIYRYVNDKFIVLFPKTKAEKAYKIIENFRRMIYEKGVSIGDEKPIHLTFCAGIVGINKYTQNSLEIIENTKVALFSSKQKGKNRTNLIRENQSSIIIHQKNVTPKKILIIDDNMSIVFVVKNHLENLNYDVETASNGEKGLLRAQVLKPDIMIVDILLPQIDGFEVIKTIKNDSNLNKTKIIVITSYYKKEYIETCKSMGVKDFLVKPFTMKELENRIENLIH